MVISLLRLDGYPNTIEHLLITAIGEAGTDTGGNNAPLGLVIQDLGVMPHAAAYAITNVWTNDQTYLHDTAGSITTGPLHIERKAGGQYDTKCEHTYVELLGEGEGGVGGTDKGLHLGDLEQLYKRADFRGRVGQFWHLMSHGETINFLLWAQPHGAVRKPAILERKDLAGAADDFQRANGARDPQFENCFRVVSWRAGDDELGGDGLELLMKDGECGEEVVVDGEKIEFFAFFWGFL
ncbi:hypothetical protein B0H14DRAFT_3144195 [Mycena olivaceomarginata]|nr:hypothetical protein B0H14DRAFT_3144195 [Mycena olivaceomarginata]